MFIEHLIGLFSMRNLKCVAGNALVRTKFSDWPARDSHIKAVPLREGVQQVQRPKSLVISNLVTEDAKDRDVVESLERSKRFCMENTP
jgi:hypothetical protein